MNGSMDGSALDGDPYDGGKGEYLRTGMRLLIYSFELSDRQSDWMRNVHYICTILRVVVYQATVTVVINKNYMDPYHVREDFLEYHLVYPIPPSMYV